MIVVILAMIAATVVPRLIAMERSTSDREFRMGIRRMGIEAREAAITRRQVASVTYDETQPALMLVLEDQNEETTLKTLPIAEGARATRFAAGLYDVNGAQWRLRFYPDGRSDGGGIEFESAGATFSLYAEPSGSVEFANGAMPDPTARRWQAGEREQRL